MGFSRKLNTVGEYILPPHIVPFPRGFAFGHDGRLFLASGIGPGGKGDNAILAFDPDRRMLPTCKERNPRLSQLELAIASNGNIVGTTTHPSVAANAERT